MVIQRFARLLFVFAALVPGVAGAEQTASPARIVFLAGGRSHGPGEHEFRAGCMLLVRALNDQSGLPVKAEVIQGWPADASVLDGAKAIVFYSDGTSVVGKGWEKTDALARAGTGLMFMHYAVHPSKADGEKFFRPWIGGAFEDNWSVNPHWVADMETLPGHPVSRGIQGPVRCFDEFYYNMRFRPNRGEVLDLATATPSRDRVVRYINMWNEHGVAGLDKKQTLMWGVERPDGGRGVGFTGGHYHRNWAVDGFRTLVLNAIVWTAGLEVPASGVKSLAVTEDDLNANLDDKGPNKPRIKVPTAAEIDALKPAAVQADREAKFPKIEPAAAPVQSVEPSQAPAPNKAAGRPMSRRNGPVEPAEATVTLALPSDLEATLFAAEPLLSSPSDIDVDAMGRVWVCEVMNYRGKKDTRPEGDRILVLEDTDGDGQADKQTVFHQGRDVDSALGICVIGEGPGRKVIVSCAPDVFVFHDDDGDLKADRKETLFTKTGVPQHDHSVHAFVVGPDGRWYFNFGNTGKAVHDRDGKPVSDRSGNIVNDSGKPYRQGMVFRCKPDGTDFEVLGHNFRNNYEVAVDSYGSLWQSDNDDDGNKGVRINYVMEHGNFGYVDERTGAGWKVPRTNLEATVPLQHWHQNDPGVVPNLLLTGGGSPTGICVYEGRLLPERFRGALVHCDAGPNVVRAYFVRPAAAGYEATMETVIDGSADRWFRPSDVCVAPDGSLIVADWYDPGVGGHGMGDTQKGRIFRVAPQGSKWTVPAVELTTTVGAVAALASPNLCTRATALERLAEEPDAAAAAIDATLSRPVGDDRYAARLAWAVGMLPGRAAATVATLAASNDPRLRAVAVRMCRLSRGDVIGLVEKLAADPEPAVRREAAIALHGLAGERADRAWAELAARHVAGDRWELEALGLGADGVWDGRLEAWLAKTSGPKYGAGQEIVWRSRGAKSAAMLALIIADANVTTAQSLALVRALDFQDTRRVIEALAHVVKDFNASDEKRRVILPELVARLDHGAAADPDLARRIDEAVGYVAGTQAYVDLVGRFKLEGRTGELLDLAAAEGTSESIAAAAVGTALVLAGDGPVKARLKTADPAALRLLSALGIRGDGAARTILEGVLLAGDTRPEIKSAAVAALARSQAGAKSVVALAREGKLAGPLSQAAAVAIAGCPWADVRQAAADVLPMPKAKGGALPPLTELLKRNGNVGRGKAVFAGAGTCAKCHIVGGEGKNVGPNLSGVGAKLSRQALYESILAPSAAISHSYETYTALLDDGRAVTGLLVSQSPEAVVIRGVDGIDQTLPAADVGELVKQPVSIMPADLATALTAEELVDLVAWLETLRAVQ